MQSRAPYYLEVCTISDFGRLVCAFERAPLLTFSFVKGHDHVLATQIDFLDNVPVIYYVKYANEGQFLAYRHSGGIEEVTIVNSVSNPVYMYSPIISIEKFPRAFSRTSKVSKNAGYVPIKLKDLNSLAKIASYKMIYDEAPLPLFVYEQQKKFVIGTPVTLGESDNLSYFYYITMTEKPLSYFVKYASQKNMVACMSDNLEEHGYIYIKLVNPATPNPWSRRMNSTAKASYTDRIEDSAEKNNSKIILALDISADKQLNPEVIGEIIDQTALYLCAVKINFHLLLTYSPEQIRRFNELIHSYGLQSIADIKLNDIPNTNSVAIKHLQLSGFDCIIANPIMGRNSLSALVNMAHMLNMGVLSVVYMSSPYAKQTYGLRIMVNRNGAKANEKTLYEIFLKYSSDVNVDGIIVGANRLPLIKSISSRSTLPIYSPGVGVQGGLIEKAMKNGSNYVIIGRSILRSSNPRELLNNLREVSNKYWPLRRFLGN